MSASTQNQAKAAILYLYKQVLGIDLPWLDEVVQAKTPKRLPVVLTASEVRELLLHLHGTTGLITQLLYGTGMRLSEALRLRVKDIDTTYAKRGSGKALAFGQSRCCILVCVSPNRVCAARDSDSRGKGQ